MSVLNKFAKFCSENVVFITGGAIILGVHWGWVKLQQIPALVPPDKRKELPIVTGTKVLVDTIKDEYDHLTEKKSSTTKET